MRPDGSRPRETEERAHGFGRVTSLSGWLARRREAAGIRPRVSVVIPAHNAEATLAECLTRLCNSTFGEFEILLVDDGSSDQTRAIAANFPLRIVPTGGRLGPARARNIGAREAAGDILVFLDADAMVQPETLTRIVERFEQGDVDGLVGVQAAGMRYRNLPSQYKNLWMRWTYARQTGDVPLFYTTAAAIGRETFLASGGFDESYVTPSLEDTAFGQKLARQGVRVRIEPRVEVEHVKRYSLAGLLRTDWARAVALTRLKLRQPADLMRNDTSVPGSYLLSVPLAVLGVAGLGAGALLGLVAPLAAGALALAGALVCNREFLAAVRASEGWGRAAGAVPLLWLELLVVGAGAGAGLLTYALGRRY
jgi:glycosyltransferase involved in cell wall biosynthesis